MRPRSFWDRIFRSRAEQAHAAALEVAQDDMEARLRNVSSALRRRAEELDHLAEKSAEYAKRTDPEAAAK